MLWGTGSKGWWRVVRRGWGQWALVAVLVLAGGATSLVNALGWGHWTWLAVTAAVVALVAAVPFKVVSARLEAREVRRQALTGGAVGGARRRVRDVVDLTQIGIHPAVLPDGVVDVGVQRRLPSYVRRDQHEAVVKRLVLGGFVVVQGDSGAGKSRLAFEAVRQVFAEHVLFAPEPSVLAAAIEEMRQLRSAVLWLDDLDRYVESDVLTATAVGELLAEVGHQRVVVATLRYQAREAIVATDSGAEGVIDRRRRLLEMAEVVLISREFTTTELDRAYDLEDDPRIADALAHADRYGLAEYLAAGPQLRDKWLAGRDTHPRGFALAAAAIDCRRAGFIAPLPMALLDAVHIHYLPSNPRTRIEDREVAWEWATELWRHTSAMLEPVNTSDNTVIVFDYLVDHVQRENPVDDPPQNVLEEALGHADATTATTIGHHAYQRGRYSLALAAHQRALTHDTGPDHPDTLTSRSYRARALRALGRLDEAEQENRTVLDISTRVLGPDHPDTLISRSNLAAVFRALGRLDEAEQENRSVLEARTRVLGPDHPNTLTSRNNLAAVLKALDRLDEAEQEHRTVLDARTQMLGPNHPSTLTSRNNLAEALRESGRLNEAEQEHRAVIAAATRVLGPNHRNTLTSRNNLAEALRELGRLNEAEQEHRTVLDAMTRMLGPDHPDTVDSRNNLAKVLEALDRPDDT